jgi:5-(carboxyamino)imidazole ribonucleotide mutase
MSALSKKVAVVMGSSSDRAVMDEALEILKEFEIDYQVNVISAHRKPEETREFAKNARDSGIEVIIAGAGKSAHLPGVIASYTTLPVIGVPIKTEGLDGLDSLFSIVQMPAGVPVACMSLDGAKNAAIMAVQILSLKYNDLKGKLKEYKNKLRK